MADTTPTSSPVHAEALERFRLAADAEAKQREREQEDLRFVDLDQQWPDDVKQARNGYQPGNGLPAVPARPCLTINKLRQPVEQVSNQARQARLALSFAPKSAGASQDIAEAFEDIARAIQANSRAALARQWAFDRAAKCGRGFYRILTEYSNDGDNDLDIVYKRILNQASVYLDPAAQEPDWSDGEYAFVTEDIPWSRYKRAFPKSKLAECSDDALSGIGNDTPTWVKDSPDGKLIRIAEYWAVERERVPVTLYAMADGTEKNLTDEEAAQEPGARPVLDADTGQPLTRAIERRTVRFYKINAIEVLEESDWPGRYIPIVPVIGQEVNVNGERRWTGIVRPAMDAQRTYNYMRSAQVEAVGLAPRAPFVAYAETIEGYESWWAQANTRNFPYLPIKAATVNGQPLPPPQRDVIEPAIQAVTIAAQSADGDIKATTGIFDASLGNLNPSDRSGKAILALQKQAEQSTSGFLDNLAQMSMNYEGKILRDLIPKVYNRPGRIVAAIGEDDDARQIMLGKPFKVDNGAPVAADPRDPSAKVIDLAKGEYSVAITVGKSFTTRREEASSAMGELMSAAPQLVPVMADKYVENLDFPGARQIADRLKKQLPPDLQEGGDNNPEVLRGKLQQAGQAIEVMSKELEAKNEFIRTEQVKAQAGLQEKLLQEQAENQRQAEKIAAEKQIAALKAFVELAKAEISAQSATAAQHTELAMQELGYGHEHAKAAADRQHEAGENERERQVSREDAEASRAFEAEQAERGRQAEREARATEAD
jgi:hypothetical protein